MLEFESQILLIIVCILFSGLFSGLEIAYISRDKLNFEIKVEHYRKLTTARVVQTPFFNPERKRSCPA